ncbi:hypothetical protein HC762_01730 [bacterium]|nr:hypothetical protein [bacterium]
MLCCAEAKRPNGEDGEAKLDSAFWERPSPNPEDSVSEQNPASSTIRPGKKKVHSLIDKVFGRQNLALAWSRVKKNGGSAGMDNVTITTFDLRKSYSLDLLHRKRRDGTSRPHPVKRVEMEKSDGGVRKLGIPTVLDRVAQQALVQRMDPIFAPQFLPCSFGYTLDVL